MLLSKTWVVYILQCTDGSLYTGITNRLDVRIKAHQEGAGARYTRGRLPVKLVYTEDCNDHSHALKREYAVKKLSKSKKLELIGEYREKRPAVPNPIIRTSSDQSVFALSH